MKAHPLAKVLVALLTIALIVPSVFLIAPQKTKAGWPVSVIATLELPFTVLSSIKNTLVEIHSFTSKVAAVAMWMNTFIFQPLLFVLSGRLLQSTTSGVINFAIGTINGTGAPQFVRDVRGNMQAVSDASAFAFINLYGMHSRSPFSASIVSALRIDYLQSSSLAGFFAANRDTLYRTSPNINAYLAGDWSQGGLASWFALTTQDNNNPYMLYLNSQSRLRSLTGPGVGGATGARASELAWGQGMLSWCGADESINPETQVYGPADGTDGGIPGDPCTMKDGTAGRIKTPGSVISSTLGKALGATQDKIVEMGALAAEVNGIMGDITRVMQTVNIAQNVLGGYGSNGLMGAGGHGSGVFLGVSSANIYQNAAGSPLLTLDKTVAVNQYESAWLTIKSSADFVAASLNSLINSCANVATKSEAQAALSAQVQPTLAAADAAAAVVTAARAMIQKIQDELNAGRDASADIQTLNAMPPSSTDLTSALQESQTLGGATASPEGSLTVSGGSMVDRMNLIRANATALASTTCSSL